LPPPPGIYYCHLYSWGLALLLMSSQAMLWRVVMCMILALTVDLAALHRTPIGIPWLRVRGGVGREGMVCGKTSRSPSAGFRPVECKAPCADMQPYLHIRCVFCALFHVAPCSLMFSALCVEYQTL
jgi:hypothetical protein